MIVMGIGGFWRIKQWLTVLKNDAVLLYFAWKHPRTPGLVKALLIALVVYVFSPLDILPDYLPFIGVTDDITVILSGLLILTRMLPPAVREDCGKASEQWHGGIKRLLGWLLLLALGWILLLGLGFYYLFSRG